jgi:hypothetical protein
MCTQADSPESEGSGSSESEEEPDKPLPDQKWRFSVQSRRTYETEVLVLSLKGLVELKACFGGRGGGSECRY